MSTEMQRIRDQLRRAVMGGAWHGPSVSEAIASLSHERGWRRLTPATHAPVELVLHIAAWLEIARRRFEGEVVTPTTADDWPGAPAASPTAWQAGRDRVFEAHSALDEAIARADDRRLAELIPGQDSDIYHLLHGVLQHCIYHAGQIQLIARALEDGAGS